MLEHGLVAFAGLLFCFEGPAEVALVVALVGLWLAAPREDWPRFGWIEGLIAGWAVSGWLGVIRAAVEGHPSSSEDVLRPLLALAFMVGRFGYATATSKVLARVWAAILGVMLLNGIVGLAQVTFGALPIDRWFLKNPNSPQIWVPGKIGQVRCATGLLYNRLKFAHLGFPAVGLFLIVRTGRRWSDLGQWAAAGVITTALLFAHARAALAAFLLALVVSRLSSRRRIVTSILGVGVVVALAAVVGVVRPALAARVWEDVSIRAHIFDAAWNVFRDHPIWGVGHGQYRVLLSKTWDGRGTLLDAHNLYLNVLVETGLLGGVCYLAALALAFRTAFRSLKAGNLTALQQFAIFTQSYFALLGMTHVVTHHAQVSMLYWCTLGILAAPANDARTAPSPG
ncbi:MAG: O-antigen ligase family protein [Deltaproteobacteria bacterium]|jgi:O-antigen ligase|nr:O-antigen ligase family protein [Deltaproteobacteria bacterium]